MICISAEFEVRKRNHYNLYRLVGGPEGFILNIWENCEWKCLYKGKEIVGPITSILPKCCDFGKDWTYKDFLLALTFWGEGRKYGKI